MADSIEPINTFNTGPPLDSTTVTDALIILEQLNINEGTNKNVIPNSETINTTILEEAEIIQHVATSGDDGGPGTSHASMPSLNVTIQNHCNHMQDLREVVLEHIIETDNELRELVFDDLEEEVDDYEEDEDENDDLDEDAVDEIAISANSISTNEIAAVVVDAASATSSRTSGTCRNIGMSDKDIRQAFSELFLVSDNGTAQSNQTNLMGSSLVASSSPSSLTSVSPGASQGTSTNNHNITINENEVKAQKSTLAPTPKPYNRQEFLFKLQEVGAKSSLNALVIDEFTLSQKNVDALLENLNWMYGDIDVFFQLPKLQLQKLEYLCMIKFTAGDYALHKTGGKCRDRELILEYKPMEVLYHHYVYFMSLVVLEKIPQAYQVLKEMKASTSYANIASNGGRWNNIFEFLQKNLEILLNYITGRLVFKNVVAVPSVDRWDQDQRWYLSLACFLGSKEILKPIEMDVEAVFDALIDNDMFTVEWGFFMVDELDASTHQKKSGINQLKDKIILALMKENDVCRNPYSILCHTKCLIDQQTEINGQLVSEDLIIEFRNILNKYGEIVQVRLIVASQLEKLPVFPGRTSLLKYTLEKATEFNSAHPEANYRLAMHYDSMKTSGIVLSLRYLKASIVVDSSNFVAVMEYCKILMGKHFRLMSAAFGNTTVQQSSGDVNSTQSGVNVPSIILGFTTGVGPKFWTSDQISELRLLMFYSLIMTGAEEEALEVLLPIYRNNKIIYALKNVDKIREKYGWSSTYVTLRQLINIFTETYEAILEDEELEKSVEVTTTMNATKRNTDEQLKVMLALLLSYLHEEFS